MYTGLSAFVVLKTTGSAGGGTPSALASSIERSEPFENKSQSQHDQSVKEILPVYGRRGK